MPAATSIRRTASVARKEFLHMLRDPGTLFFALAIPVIELFMLGYAIDTNVKFVRTVVLDQANTWDSKRLLEAFENSKDFSVVARVYTDEELSRTIVAGKARVGIKIPEDYSRRLEARQTAQVLVLVDAGFTDRDLGLEGGDVRPAEANLEDVFVTLARAEGG